MAGQSRPSARSTLAYANEHLPWPLFEQIFLVLWVRCRRQLASGRRDGLLQKLPGKLYSLDVTVIDVCARARQPVRDRLFRTGLYHLGVSWIFSYYGPPSVWSFLRLFRVRGLRLQWKKPNDVPTQRRRG